MIIKWTETSGKESAEQPVRTRAVQYVRMSTEHQKYSTDNQITVIQQYAEKRGFDVIRTYADEGKSGLTLTGRAALQRLLDDIGKGEFDFKAILVYDVSRWGRFQDPDEAAAIELQCKKAGIVVHYCAEQFENDGTISSSIIKTVKRAMAGEYSRELSVKVFAGQSNLVRLGYRQGGPAGNGLRRILIDQNGIQKGELKRGQHKSITTDRVVLVPGPKAEVDVLKKVYRLFLESRLGEREIADVLNEQGFRTDLDKPWTRGTVHQLLINEKYVGDNVWGRTSFKLKHKHVRNPECEWIRSTDAFEPIVDRQMFNQARQIIEARSKRLSNEQLLALLTSVLKRNGQLSGIIIDETEYCPSSSTYRSRFGNLLRAYALVGYFPDHDYKYLETNKALRRMHPDVMSSVVSKIKGAGGRVTVDSATDLMTVNQEFSLSLVIVRCFQTNGHSLRWKIRLDTILAPDLTVAVRMNRTNSDPKDYYLFPRLDMHTAILRLCEYNDLTLDSYRFDTLEPLYAMAARTSIEQAA
jgi:DNA invertase Pin-like site-specific DNA recombinase